MSIPKNAILIGAGERGRMYASYTLKHPEELRSAWKEMKLGLTKSNSLLFSSLAKLMLRFPGLVGKIPGLSKYRIWNL
ncbi:hypothetical protein KJ966_07915 [bacterium]|nr:hypothetical protein [bacterium]